MLPKLNSAPNSVCSNSTAISVVTNNEHQVVQHAKQLFANSPYNSLRQVGCAYHEGVLILRGRVPTFYMKQIAQTMVRNVDAGIHIDNRLVVDE